MALAALILLLVCWGPQEAQLPVSDSPADISARLERCATELPAAKPKERNEFLLELASLASLLRERLASKDETGRTWAHRELARCQNLRATWALGEPLPTRLSWADEAFEQSRKSGIDAWIARIAYSYQGLLKQAGRLDEALIVLDTAAREAVEDRVLLPFLLYALAELEKDLGRFDEALSRLRDVELSLTDQAVHRRFAWRVAGTRGQIFLDLGLPDLAAEAFEFEFAAVEANDEAQATDRIAAYLHRSNLWIAQERFQRTVSFIETTLENEELFSGFEDWNRVLRFHRAYALEQLAEQQGAAGIGARKELLELVDEGLDSRESARAWRLLAENALRRGELRLAAERLGESRVLLAGRKDSEARVLDAFHVASTAARLALAFEAGAEQEQRAALQELSGALDAMIESRKRFAPKRPGGVGHFAYGHHRRGLVLEQALLRRIEPEEAPARVLERLLQVQSLGSRTREADLSASASQVVSQLLAEHHGLIVYVPSTLGSVALSIDRGGPRLHNLATEGVLEEALRNHRRSWSRLLEEVATEEGAAADRLATALFADGLNERIGKWRSVTFVGDLLGSIPFELAQRKAGRLGLTHAVDHLPSLTYGLLLAERSSSATRSCDVFTLAAPWPATEVRERWAEVDRLPLDREDLEALDAGFARTRVRRRLFSEARASNLLAPEFSGARVGRLLAHGVQDSRLERPACLVLTPENEEDDGLLTCDEVEALAAPDLVLLLSCRTARGPARRGDEAVGHQGGAWLAAGAQVVLLSRTDLDLEHALALDQELCKGLRAGASPAEALRRARVALLDSGLVDHPAKLGLVFALGLGQRPIF